MGGEEEGKYGRGGEGSGEWVAMRMHARCLLQELGQVAGITAECIESRKVVHWCARVCSFERQSKWPPWKYLGQAAGNPSCALCSVSFVLKPGTADVISHTEYHTCIWESGYSDINREMLPSSSFHQISGLW